MFTWQPEITFRKLSPPAAMLSRNCSHMTLVLGSKAGCMRCQRPLFPLAPANQICMVHFSTRLCLHFAQSNNSQPESMSQGVDRASTRPTSESTNKFHGNDLCTRPEPVPFETASTFSHRTTHTDFHFGRFSFPTNQITGYARA